MRLMLAAAVALGLGWSAGHAEATQTWRPTLADVAAVEAKIELPKGAEPIAAYARYYSGVVVSGHRLVKGYYLRGFGRPGVYLKPYPDEIDDGGCSVVTVYFDLTADRTAGAFCNGYA
jgi:hypothetical protein